MGFLENTYQPAQAFLSLGDGYADRVKAASFPKSILRFRNDRHAKNVGLDVFSDAEWITHFSQFKPLPGAQPHPLALRYHGHQFRHYNPELGDGRGFLFAQLYDQGGRLLDLGTKGSGTTPYSRGGDGRLTLKGGVREVLATEMLEALGVNTSKSFSLIETGEALMRNDEPSPTRSSVLVRLSEGHIRIGTFQRFAQLNEIDNINKLVAYCLKHYFSDHKASKNIASNARENALMFLDAVCERTARLAAELMVSGFVHGVLNSDNINITGECFDYGPWRFLPTMDLKFTAAYFDHNGLYCYGRQPDSIYWNLYRLGEVFVDSVDEQAIRDILDTFPQRYQKYHKEKFLHRLGIKSKNDKDNTALLTTLHNFLLACPIPFDQVFFDWYGGTYSADVTADKKATPKTIAISESPFYQHESFAPFYEALSHYEPLRPKALEHLYFQRSTPCSMLIEDVETIWQSIDQDDDWSLFYKKIESIRQMGKALAT